MKKYIITLVLLTTMVSYLFAEDKEERSAWDMFVIPKVGMTASNITNLDGDYRLGAYIGGGVQVYFSPKWSSEVEISYCQSGTKNATLKDTPEEKASPYKFNLDMINTTYLLHYYPSRSVSFYTGINAGRLINLKGDFNGKKIKMKDHLHHDMLSIPLGVTFETEKLLFDARYNYQINKMPDSKAAKRQMPDTHINMVQVTIGYKLYLF